MNWTSRAAAADVDSKSEVRGGVESPTEACSAATEESGVDTTEEGADVDDEDLMRDQLWQGQCSVRSSIIIESLSLTRELEQWGKNLKFYQRKWSHYGNINNDRIESHSAILKYLPSSNNSTKPSLRFHAH